MRMEIDCRKEVINICLNLFIEKSLTATSTRSLSSALKPQNEDTAPYGYMIITAVANYMIFAEDSLIYPQIQIAKSAIRGFISSKVVFVPRDSEIDVIAQGYMTIPSERAIDAIAESLNIVSGVSQDKLMNFNQMLKESDLSKREALEK